MNKKLLVGLGPLVAIVAFVLMPATAQALEPHWFENGGELVKGAAPILRTSESGILRFSWGGAEKFKCKATDKEELWNPLVGPGEDAITELKFPKCTGKKLCPEPHETLGVEAEELSPPWKSVLVAGAPIRDEIKGVDLVVSCSGRGVAAEITGTVTPAVGNGFLNFTGAPSSLENEFHEVVTVIKKDRLKAIAGKITAKMS